MVLFLPPPLCVQRESTEIVQKFLRRVHTKCMLKHGEQVGSSETGDKNAKRIGNQRVVKRVKEAKANRDYARETTCACM